jgi:hypothetical protein
VAGLISTDDMPVVAIGESDALALLIDSNNAAVAQHDAAWSGPESSDREQLHLRRENEGTQEQIREKL